MAATAVASVALLMYGSRKSTGDYDLSSDAVTGEILKCPKKKLLAILEDMQMEYTPYYTHYYHLLTALPTEYRNKTILQQKLREKICAKLEQKTMQIQENIVEKYLIDGGVNELATWINFYCKACPQVAAIVNLFQINEDKLFLKTPPEKPDWDLQFSPRLSKKVYL